MRLTIVITIACLMQVNASSLAQRITLSKKNVPLKYIFKELKSKTGFNFLFTESQLKNALPVNLSVRDVEIADVLNVVFAEQPFYYRIEDKTVLITERKVSSQRIISGVVSDKNDRSPLPKVTVSIKGTKTVAQTDKEGRFSISLPTGARVLEFRYLGYITLEIPITENGNYNIFMEEEQKTLNETVITGMVERKASTYTGAAKVMTAKELKQISPTNVFTAVAALDPSFRIVPNNVSGGDINVLPEIQMRGQNSFPTLGAELVGNPNLPLFILDGFQVNLQAIADLDMNLIASVTLLKDASATATYGSRGANGVMVVTTVIPPIGKIEVTLTNNFTLSAPDLSVYNMLNSSEKLDFERRSGIINTYAKEYYNAERYKAMSSGVNTDWKSIPIQTGYTNQTTLGLRGGDQVLRFNLSFSGNLQQGVMKAQDRNNYQGSFSLSYNTRKFQFQNNVTATQIVSNASPYGSFSDYLKLNPYWKPYDENGLPNKYLENIIVSATESSLVLNPLTDVSYNTIDNRNKNFTIRNNTSVRYNASNSLWFSASLGLSKVNATVDNFYSGLDSRFATVTDISRKGSYSINSSNSFLLESSGSVNFNKAINRHVILANALINVSSNKADTYTLVTEGFPFDRLDNILFATQYQAGRPTGAEIGLNRISYTGAFNYTYDNRFFTEFTYTRDGSSAYGVNNKFGTFWSAGLGWNIYNEKFLKDIDAINLLRVRGSYGSTGSLAVDPYQSQYRYNFGSTTGYYGDLGATLAGLGNPNLSWQQILKSNIGFQSTFFDNVLNVNADFYKEVTQNALTTVSLAPSTGFSSFSENLGMIQNTGMQLELGLRILNDPGKSMRWNITASAATNRSILKKLSDRLKAFNDILNANNVTQATANPQFIEGQSTTAFYAVKSMGIDPITGQEVFVKRDGSLTYDWNVSDKVFVGDTRPKWTGSINSSFLYGGFAFNINLNYNYGGVMYNSTLLNRVEAVNPVNNVDRRAYELGWKGPGDVSQFKSIAESNQTKLTSRFVQNDNSIQIGSMNLSYQFNSAFTKKIGMQGLTVSANTNNLVTFSSIQVERGTDNPFARQYTLGLNARF